MMTNDEVFKALENQITMPELKDDEAKQVAQAYSDMFTALTYTNLLQGKSLGQSWFNAIGQIDSFIKTKDKYNSVTNHMQRMLNKHRKDLAKKMMTDPNRDKIINVSDQQRQQMTEKAKEMMQSAMKTVDALIEKYRQRAEKLKEKLAEEAKKRQEKLLKDAKRAEAKAKQAKKAEKPAEKVAPVAPAPQKAVRPQSPVLSEFAKHKAAQQFAEFKAAPAQRAPQNTAAQLIAAKQKMKMLAAQRAQIQAYMNQNQRAA